MYEINTHNLKLYLLGLSIIFILTNGFPLLHMISDIEDRQHTKYSNVKGENFIIYYNKYYSLNATVIKHSIIYNTKTYNYAGNVILEYINYIDAHHYCKIDIPEHKFNDVIYNHIYKYYNLGRNNILLNCNNKECIYNLTHYSSGDKTYEDITCNILTIKHINEEL